MKIRLAIAIASLDCCKETVSMLKHILSSVLFSLLFASTVFATPTSDVKRTVDEVIRIVSSKEMKKNPQIRRQQLKKTISRIFDYTEMAQRSLGKQWKELSPAEKKEFSELFSNVLENSYGDKIESYNNEKIVYMKENIEGNRAEVKSKVVTTKHDEYTIDYRLINKNGKWVVYDVVIEGVSLVSNYRTQFSRTISENGYPELLKRLKGKNEEFKSP